MSKKTLEAAPTDRLNSESGSARSRQKLDRYYQLGLIPPEKKPFLVDLQRSSGPYLAVNDGDFICDVASQIATLGLGFNPGALFGAAQFLESWTGYSDSESIQAVSRAYLELLRRKLGDGHYAAHFCASGAEAVEIALGKCFAARKHGHARRVLAFQGSFHGRMMVALSATWNPAKREPFAWPGCESTFVSYPEMDGDDICGPQIPVGWIEFWSRADVGAPVDEAGKFLSSGDRLLASEVASLAEIRQKLASGDIYAILIEPMQCEGGDRYSSARFHQALINLSKAFQIPLVYDEIQTGFGLGGEFFWHRMFKLCGPDGQSLFPEHVVCAKKAQTGIVLSRATGGQAPAPENDHSISHEGSNVASLVRGYIQASILDQFEDQITKMEGVSRQNITRLVEKHGPEISRPRVKGLCFAFDFEDANTANQFVQQRFPHGLLYYPAGTKTVRFRYNLAFRETDVRLAWQQIELALQSTFASSKDANGPKPRVPVTRRSPDDYYRFHKMLIAEKLHHMKGAPTGNSKSVFDSVRGEIRDQWPDKHLRVTPLDHKNYAEYRDRILRFQEDVYEPARQTPAREFDALFEADRQLAFLVLEQDQIVAMTFAGPLTAFQDVRGAENDPNRNDPQTFYMVDLTVAEQFRGRLGRIMKQAITRLALNSGATAIHGRNRDRLASRMWAINLSLGSYATQHLADDYPDEAQFRDCIYYRCPTVWREPPINLSNGMQVPMGVGDLTADFVERHLPELVNKLTLSNFVTEHFLDLLQQVSNAFPKDLRHCYTASGLSECVDKVVKVLWRHRPGNTRLLTIDGHDFGSGSFVARSLSGVGEPYFDTVKLPPPGNDDSEFFQMLERELRRGNVLGMFAEPLQARTMKATDRATLVKMVAICRHHAVPVVFNETAGLFYRYHREAFSAGGTEDTRPDIAMSYLGGQMALVCMTAELFLDDPLLLISTWDGDSFSLAQFHHAMSAVQTDVQRYFDTTSSFQARLTGTMDRLGQLDYELANGIGSISAAVPDDVAKFFAAAQNGRLLCCPSYCEMKRFIELEGC